METGALRIRLLAGSREHALTLRRGGIVSKVVACEGVGVVPFGNRHLVAKIIATENSVRKGLVEVRLLEELCVGCWREVEALEAPHRDCGERAESWSEQVVGER